MNTKITLAAIAATGLLLTAGAASAADIYTPVPEAPPMIPAPPAVYDWSGFYIGINGGFAWGNADADTPTDQSISGGLIGGTVGYNFQVTPNWVFGLEADYDWSSINGGPAGPPDAEQHLTSVGTARVRLGYAMDTWLPYITGGFAWGTGDRDSAGESASASHTGWTIGAGIEAAVTQNVTAKIEYKYIDLGTQTYDFPVGIDPDVSLTTHAITAGLNWQF